MSCDQIKLEGKIVQEDNSTFSTSYKIMVNDISCFLLIPQNGVEIHLKLTEFVGKNAEITGCAGFRNFEPYIFMTQIQNSEEKKCNPVEIIGKFYEEDLGPYSTAYKFESGKVFYSVVFPKNGYDLTSRVISSLNKDNIKIKGCLGHREFKPYIFLLSVE